MSRHRSWLDEMKNFTLSSSLVICLLLCFVLQSYSRESHLPPKLRHTIRWSVQVCPCSGANWVAFAVMPPEGDEFHSVSNQIVKLDDIINYSANHFLLFTWIRQFITKLRPTAKISYNVLPDALVVLFSLPTGC